MATCITLIPSCTSIAEFLQEHRHVLEARLQPIMREIADTRARSRDELEGEQPKSIMYLYLTQSAVLYYAMSSVHMFVGMYRKIVSYALLRSGLGSPTEIAVVREATGKLWDFVTITIIILLCIYGSTSSCSFSSKFFIHMHLLIVYSSLAALQSVFPQTELGTFMALSKLDKEKQMRELTNIVTGIRLFNKNCGKGGAGIDDCELTEPGVPI